MVDACSVRDGQKCAPRIFFASRAARGFRRGERARGSSTLRKIDQLEIGKDEGQRVQSPPLVHGECAATRCVAPRTKRRGAVRRCRRFNGRRGFSNEEEIASIFRGLDLEARGSTLGSRRRVISPEAANFRARIRHAREGSCDRETRARSPIRCERRRFDD